MYFIVSTQQYFSIYFFFFFLEIKLDSNLELVREQTKLNGLKGIKLKYFGEKLNQLFTSKSAQKNVSENKIAEEINSKVDKNYCISYLDESIGCKNLLQDSDSRTLEKQSQFCTSNENNTESINFIGNSNIVIDSGYSSNEVSENIDDSNKHPNFTQAIDIPNSENSISRKRLNINITMDDIISLNKKLVIEQDKKKEAFVRFRAVIDPTKNVLAEQELAREISKDMFSEV